MNIPNNNFLSQLVRWLDRIALVLYCFIVSESIVMSATYVLWGSVVISSTWVYVVLMVIAVIKLFLYFEESKAKVVAGIIILALAYYFKNKGMYDFTFMIIPMLAFFNTRFTEVAKAYICSSLPTLAIIASLAALGLIPNITETDETRLVMDMQFLGFPHHNFFMMYFLFVTFAIIYLTRDKSYRKWIHMLLILLTLFFWLLTGSNTSAIIGIGTCLVMLLDDAMMRIKSERAKKLQEKLLAFFIGMPVYGVLITLAGALLVIFLGHGNPYSTMISRFRIAAVALEATGIEFPVRYSNEPVLENWSWIFGNGGERWYSVYGWEPDNLYVMLFMANGFAILLPYLACQIQVRYRLYKNRRFTLGLICAMIVVFGLMECHAVRDIGCAVFSILMFTDLSYEEPEPEHVLKRTGRRRRRNGAPKGQDSGGRAAAIARKHMTKQ